MRHPTTTANGDPAAESVLARAPPSCSTATTTCLAATGTSTTSSSSEQEDKPDASSSPTSLRYHHLTDIDRVFCLSDLHTDHVDNLKWLSENLAASSSSLTARDLVIVAGDISHEFAVFEKSLDLLLDHGSGCRVLFVPGNHEAWLNKQQERKMFASSLDKLERFYEICRAREGVYVDPVYLDGPHPLWILPLESWYDGTLSFDEELCEGFGK